VTVSFLGHSLLLMSSKIEEPVHLPFPEISRTPSTEIQLQQPIQLTSFSYNEKHEFEFSDSALRYYVDPPPGAKLDYGFSKWIRRQDERGRIDSLLKAYSKAKQEYTLGEIGVVSWRGVMTK
jgi:RAT1-interacting protein